MILYHGSDHIIEKPVFGEGKSYNDYGRGFYCTEHVELAKEWACATGGDGYANRYQLEMGGLSVLNLNTPEYNILNWLAILLENRKFNVAEGLPQRAKAYILENFKVDYKKYDLIIGYRAILPIISYNIYHVGRVLNYGLSSNGTILAASFLVTLFVLGKIFLTRGFYSLNKGQCVECFF